MFPLVKQGHYCCSKVKYSVSIRKKSGDTLRKDFVILQ